MSSTGISVSGAFSVTGRARSVLFVCSTLASALYIGSWLFLQATKREQHVPALRAVQSREAAAQTEASQHHIQNNCYILSSTFQEKL